jgi:HK97 gp10 family phage protein
MRRGGSVSVKGVTAHTNRLKRMAANRTLTDRALYAAGQLIEIEAEIGITAGSVSGKGHVASNPGEYPNADTRQLDTSIDTVVVGHNRVDVVSNAPYSAFLEFGTSRMEARPFMAPSVAKKHDEAVALIQRAVAQSTR